MNSIILVNMLCLCINLKSVMALNNWDMSNFGSAPPPPSIFPQFFIHFFCFIKIHEYSW